LRRDGKKTPKTTLHVTWDIYIKTVHTHMLTIDESHSYSWMLLQVLLGKWHLTV